MGVGGHFWDMLKPYARTEGFDFLRNKRVAVDLSYWIVQHETAIKVDTRNPHLRLTFFRTINLFSKFGAFPVFVVDGTPSPLKSEARIKRFLQSSGIDPAAWLPVSSVERNNKFLTCVEECVELLQVLGMPVLKASGEGEGLCAQLNKEGRVDACITSDSDAFLFGGKCVIKRIQPNSQEPFEVYQMSDIEAGLGLKRKHLIAIALLVGNDFHLKGVQGIGIETALSFVKSFHEDEVLQRLGGAGNILTNNNNNPTTFLIKTRFPPHCSLCGHPGSKRSHIKDSCEQCSTVAHEGCLQKPIAFKCDCSSCHQDKKAKEEKKKEAWRMRVFQKLAAEPNFPNNEIIQIYLNNNHNIFTDAEPFISWKNPSTEMLIDYLAFKLNWQPSFIRQKLFPLMSTIFLRNIAKNQQTDHLLVYGQYEFDCINRTKIRFGHPFYLVSWRKTATNNNNNTPSKEFEVEEDYDDVTNVHVDDGSLMTDENMDLVVAAYPKKVDEFMERKNGGKSASSSPGVQLNITHFFRSSKGEAKRDSGNTKFSKSARRRLLLN